MTTSRHPALECGADIRAARRAFLGLLGAGGMVAACGAVAAGDARKQAERPWRMLVNEAVTGESNIFVLTSRYQPLSEYITGQLRAHPVINVEPTVDIQRFLTIARSPVKPELVFGKSVNQLAKLVRDEHYQPLVRRADAYKAAFIVSKDSAILTLADVGRTRAKVIMPDEFAATTAVARAELRRVGADGAQVVHTRYQEAVAQQITHGFAQVGVVNPTIARKWAEGGGRVLAETQPVVNWSILAAPTLADADVALLRTALLAMNTQSPALLATLGIKQWAAAERQDYLALLDYTKE
ncbi:PhnD/SsuA/transferrin family substrate-binding protein [Ramlibacter sp. PS3R-8]|uniref:phosphate/phosphite/phosphonate ABC transporter substrate-binding protein n=1 Tax=Ramlibacter sp. PS3R-8 TaxID=3133437 RepID=UPI00309BF0E8